jgi:hypothetical protein
VATVLRDYVDVKNDVGFKDQAHEMLVDIADTLNSTNVKVADMLPEYQTAYNAQTPEFWELVLKDIDALNTQVDSHNVHDLLDDYKYMLNN